MHESLLGGLISLKKQLYFLLFLVGLFGSFLFISPINCDANLRPKAESREKQRCPYCHDDSWKCKVFLCKACLSFSHEECAKEHGRCPVCQRDPKDVFDLNSLLVGVETNFANQNILENRLRLRVAALKGVYNKLDEGIEIEVHKQMFERLLVEGLEETKQILDHRKSRQNQIRIALKLIALLPLLVGVLGLGYVFFFLTILSLEKLGIVALPMVVIFFQIWGSALFGVDSLFENKRIDIFFRNLSRQSKIDERIQEQTAEFLIDLIRKEIPEIEPQQNILEWWAKKKEEFEQKLAPPIHVDLRLDDNSKPGKFSSKIPLP
ncbi:MAG: hypothetical protein AB7F43_12630 [Bacteriovoracia bacterium]